MDSIKNEAHWIFLKYFVKCSKCGYEQLNGLSTRIAVPRKCPKCQSLMYKKEESR